MIISNLVAGANPRLNYIQSKTTKMKGGYALWATHEFFTQYSFSSGNDASVVQEWIDRNRASLLMQKSSVSALWGEEALLVGVTLILDKTLGSL